MFRYVFVTNFYNHHQMAFAREMDVQTKHEFAFIETCHLTQERMDLGWGNENKPEYVISAYKDKKTKLYCQEVINNADVVIYGSCPFSMIRPRLKKRKLTFTFSERIFKNQKGIVSFVGRMIKYRIRLAPYQMNHYLLCSSAYASDDYNKIGLFKNQAYKWGYFPEVKEQDLNTLFSLKSANEKLKLLWAGRLIDWKHPEVAVSIAEKLKQAGFKFKLDIVGCGSLHSRLNRMIDEKNLNNYVELVGAMSPQRVREKMERADIFLFTSDFNEGWGAVLNEAMNSGCAVVASRAIGAVGFLLKNNENGFIYNNGDMEDLYDKVEKLAENDSLRRRIGMQAYETVHSVWNAQYAVIQLIKLCDELREKGSAGKDGMEPCSSINRGIDDDKSNQT